MNKQDFENFLAEPGVVVLERGNNWVFVRAWSHYFGTYQYNVYGKYRSGRWPWSPVIWDDILYHGWTTDYARAKRVVDFRKNS